MNESNYEKEPKPEPITDVCDECGEEYTLTSGNSLAYHFEKQQECDFVVCACPDCKVPIRIYINEYDFGRARGSGIEVREGVYADDETYELWCKLYGIELPEVYALTDRHEALIHKFGEAVMNMPYGMLMDFMGDDTDKPYPLRWV